MSKERIRFNVGGQIFETYYDTIMSKPESMLALMIQDVSVTGEIFIDRDPTLFNVI